MWLILFWIFVALAVFFGVKALLLTGIYNCCSDHKNITAKRNEFWAFALICMFLMVICSARTSRQQNIVATAKTEMSWEERQSQKERLLTRYLRSEWIQRKDAWWLDIREDVQQEALLADMMLEKIMTSGIKKMDRQALRKALYGDYMIMRVPQIDALATTTTTTLKKRRGGN